jgi:putative membrane protein insertion efficiency factor
LSPHDPGSAIIALSRLPRSAAIGLVRAYQRVLSPLVGARCRFHPSCSHYAIGAIERFGALRGGVLAMFRVARCQPLCEGGPDPVPDSFPSRPWRRNTTPNPEDREQA